MNTYLTIMVTVLVATQVIRIVQNTISLIRQNRMVKRNVEWILERDVSKEDFDAQREAFYLLRDYLKARTYAEYDWNDRDVADVESDVQQPDKQDGDGNGTEIH